MTRIALVPIHAQGTSSLVGAADCSGYPNHHRTNHAVFLFVNLHIRSRLHVGTAPSLSSSTEDQMSSDRIDTWCCYGGHPIEESVTLIEGSAGSICEDCVDIINSKLKRSRFGKLVTEFSFLSACLTSKYFAKMALTKENGLSNPAFIMPELLRTKFSSTMDFLEFVLRLISKQSEAGCSLPENYEEGLVHINIDDRALCGFTPNISLHWPKNQTYQVLDENLSVVSCLMCLALANEKFPDISTPAT